MVKQQFNVRLPDLTRGQIDELADREQMTQAEVVMLAVDRMYREEGKMDRVERISVEYSEDGLFGEEGSDGYDLQASFARFEELLTAALQERYPGAEVTVENTGSDRHRVNGQGEGEHAEGPWVGQVVHDVWVSWEWLVGEDAISE